MQPIKSSIVVFFLLAATTVFAQTSGEALRYSTYDVLGTARSVGVAGSMSALGGDFSVLNLNPAGTGAYRRSEFTFTPAFFRNHTNASLNQSGSPALSESTNELLLANLGFVFSTRPRSPNWKTSNFAIGITKIADYHQAMEYRGSTPGTLTDRYRMLANGLTPEQLSGEAALALSAGAIYDFEEDNIYESDFLGSEDIPVLKRQSVESGGYNTELIFSYGANYREKLLFGFGIGVPILSFEETKVYREDDQQDEIPFFNALKSEEYLATSGSGFNFKAGLIYKPVKFVNVGVAYHSRTRYALTDDFSSSLEYDYTAPDHDGPILANSPDGSFNYNLRTPRSLSGSLGIVIGKAGFVSAEVQHKNYGSARFKYSGRGNGDAFLEEEESVNEQIESDLSDAVTIRTGGEVALKNYRIRAGIEMDETPYSGDSGFDFTYAGGLGYRGEYFHLDLGYQYFTLEQGYIPYVVSSGAQPFVNRDISNHRFFISVGFRWE